MHFLPRKMHETVQNNNSRCLVKCLAAENLYFFDYELIQPNLPMIDKQSVNLSAKQASRSICYLGTSAAKRRSSITDASAPIPRNGNNRFEKGSPCVAFPALRPSQTRVQCATSQYWTSHRLTVAVVRN